MEKLTYRVAYDKIIDAYFKDEIVILDCNFCFCGTLAGNSSWAYDKEFVPTEHNYSFREYNKMESALFRPFNQSPVVLFTDTGKDFEDRLFSGMTAALEVLKEIHRERGENVDEVPVLTKRVLVSS